MAWLKLTGVGGSFLVKSDDIIAFVPRITNKYMSIKFRSGEDVDCFESLEEIEAMLNKNEQQSMSEAVAKDIGRDYIGVDSEKVKPNPFYGYIDTREIEGGGTK